MADVSKAQKLASARKKFKELKKEKKKYAAQKSSETLESDPPSREQTPVDNVSTQSTIPEENGNEKTPLPTYFDNVNYYNNGGCQYQQPAEFFDTFVQSSHNSNDLFLQNSSEAPVTSPLVDYFNRQQIYTPENPQNIENDDISENILSFDSTSNYFKPEGGDSEARKTSEIANCQAFDSFDTETIEQIPRSSKMESLQQLSEQVAAFINPDTESSIELQLEIRNQELASLLEHEKIKTQQSSATLQEYQSKLQELEAEIKNKELNTHTRIEQELSTLREELQCHVQTVGILVAEKTELAANLSQFQLAVKQKTSECEELQGRLKTSRSRVADLEREVALLKNEKSQYDSLGQEYNNELESLRKDHRALKEEKEELVQDLLEVREKLKSSSDTNLVFQQQMADLSNQLSMANIKIKQLTTGEMGQVNIQVEKLTQEKFALEKHVADLSQTVKTLSKEREESSLQYQQYAQQLNLQLSNLACRVEQLQKENERLAIQEQNRIKHIGDLEKQLQSIQDDQVKFAIQRTGGEIREEMDAALELVERLKTENTVLQKENLRISNEKDTLANVLGGKETQLKELENLINELKANLPDNTKLLAIMESDKVAAARAVAQNTEMKNQMESMQEVFMKLNDDKVELTEKLTLEQRNNKELIEKLQKTELHLQTLTDAIEIKDKELSHLRESSLEVDKQFLQSEQLADRLRHYEAQDHSSQVLQRELQEAKQTIAILTEEINRQKIGTTRLENNENKEINDLRQKLEQLEFQKNDLEKKLNNANGAVEENEIDNNHNLDKESAMKHLERKFLETMEDIANLTEEKQRLEHLVLQLQGETETIGEYVALYQQQRSLLKQKAIEKDQQLTQLANDREQMKTKLEKLNDLVTKLVLEKGAVPQELLDHHYNQSKNGEGLCEEHAKIHSEINKIAQNNFTIEPSNCDRENTETAEEIIALLSEIKSSNLIQPAENFHHCPWCSGQLITV